MTEAIVLGAGMVGISTALALQERGMSVLVIDRRGPGEETSFGNAGVIQMEARAPYALPRDLRTLIRYALGRSNGLRYDLGGLAGQVGALWSYYRNSAPARHRRIEAAYAPIVARAAQDHQDWITATGLDTQIRRTGLGEIYDTPQGFDAAARASETMAERHGLALRCISGNDLRREENALTRAPEGAVIWGDSWSCASPGAVVQAFARLFEARGGEILRAQVTRAAPKSGGWRVEAGQVLGAQHLVVALGPWSPAFLKPLGYRVPMLLKRGYRQVYRASGTLSRPYLLADHGVVASSAEAGIRLTTGAHLARLDAPQRLVQLTHGRDATATLMDIGAPVDDQVWHGTRPFLPGMLPLVGPLPRHSGLWANFGHGHQGFTLGPTTGRLLAALIVGEDVEMASPLAPRFGLGGSAG